METSFYEDGFRDSVKKMKSSMTLDFNNGNSAKKQKMGALLSSPDLNMLKLGSPELERMIIAQNGMVTTTPTPSQFVCPKTVTEEQEAYARGFVDALNELHRNEVTTDKPDNFPVSTMTTPMSMMNNSEASTSAVYSSATSVLATTAGSQPFRTTTALPGSIIPKSFNGQSQMYPATVTTAQGMTTQSNATPMDVTMTSSQASLIAQPAVNTRVMQLKEEDPQTVPCMGISPPISPINMENQERIKLERKRERNRVAARKCRTRKLERISRLEDRVKELKDQNQDLTETANGLREQVCKLKEQIMEHVNNGCHVMLAQNIL